MDYLIISQINLTFMHNFSTFCSKILRNVSFNSPFLAFTLTFNGSCNTVCHSAFQQLRCAQASTLTQNDTGPVGPVTPSIYWSCKMFTQVLHFFFNITRKNIA